MIIREAQYKTCKTCGAKTNTSQEVYGCDICNAVIDMNDPQRHRLAVHTHNHGDDMSGVTTDLCSWHCFFRWIQSAQASWFISMPQIHCDTDDERINLKGFLEAAAAGQLNTERQQARIDELEAEVKRMNVKAPNGWTPLAKARLIMALKDRAVREFLVENDCWDKNGNKPLPTEDWPSVLSGVGVTGERLITALHMNLED